MTVKRTRKAEWLETALNLLEKEGINGVKIDRLARQLKTSRSGFYWHFKGRPDLLANLLEYWKHEYTEVVILGGAHPPDLSPSARLLRVMRMIEEYDLDRFEVPMRAWADHDPRAAEVVASVYTMRFTFISNIFAEMGFTGADLDIRTRLWLTYATHGKAMFGKATRKKQAEILKLCHQVLTSRANGIVPPSR